MASKKGIAITAAIVAAVIGGSFAIWFTPQSNPSNPSLIAPPRTEPEIMSDVYGRHHDLASSIGSRYEGWRNGNATSEETLAEISTARVEIQRLQDQVENAGPAQEWKQSFELYSRALDAFIEYLDVVETAVRNNERGPVSEADDLNIKWQDYVDQSVDAMPGSQ